MVGVFGGDPTVVADVNDVLLYLPRWYTKPGATPRNTLIVPADDPDLSGIPLEVGSFEIKVVSMFTLSTTTTQKFRTLWGFTGTWTSTAFRAVKGPGSANTAAPDDAASANIRGYTVATQNADYSTSTSGAYATAEEISATVEVTVAGNFALQWSQAASSANNTTLQAGSFVRVTRKRT